LSTSYFYIRFREVAKEDLLRKPFHDYILPADDCLCEGQKVLNLDIKTIQVDDLEVLQCPFNFKIDKGEVMHGFCTWFEVEFCPLLEGTSPVILNTGPYER